MSDYGSNPDPSIAAAQDLAFTKGFLPLDRGNVMEWKYGDDKVVRKLASRQDKSNVLFRINGPPLPSPDPPDLDPVPAGDFCSTCWGNGKPMGVGETPESVIIVFEGIEKGPTWIAGDGEPPNGTFELTQLPAAACRFTLETDDHIFNRLFQIAPTSVSARTKPASILAFRGTGPPCNTFHENRITAKFIGGTATTFIPPIA